MGNGVVMNEENKSPEEDALSESPRFTPPPTRRDGLGLTAIWSALGTFVVATIGAMRLPMPSVFPESQSAVKIGPPENFAKGTVTQLPELNVWMFRDDEGIYAMSAVCTHLGCIAKRDEKGEFLCPCHGSMFAADGKVTAGPAPSGLAWLELTVAPDGQLVVDRTKSVRAGKKLVV
jgi:cytochrome b6-f complex iron-sulfur subunit